MKIRKVLEKDFHDIGVVYTKAFGHSEGTIKYYSGFDEYIRFSLNQGYAYVAEENVICGVALAYETPDIFVGKSLYIDLLAVLPEYQRKGICTALMEQLAQSARDKGIKQLSLRTGCYMEAYQIYKDLGFRDTRDDCRFMVKLLSM